jgi:predicted nucleic acid-binding Zn ribbon protein
MRTTFRETNLMFCTTCGNPITPEQVLCSKCGSPTAVGIMRGGGRRVADHYYLLGILHIVYSSLICLPGLMLIFFGKVFFLWVGQMSHGTPAPWFMGTIFTFVGWALLVRGAAGIAVGVGLIQRASWARIWALVMGFLSLLSVPFGTALGIYTIWVLLGAGSEEEYRRLTLQTP